MRRAAFNIYSLLCGEFAVWVAEYEVLSFKWQSETILKHFFSVVLDEAKAAAISVSLLRHTPVVLACQYFPSSASLEQVLCMAQLMVEHLVFRTSFRMCHVLRCHVISHLKLWVGYDIKTFKLNRPLFLIHLFGLQKLHPWASPVFKSMSCNIQWKWKL